MNNSFENNAFKNPSPKKIPRRANSVGSFLFQAVAPDDRATCKFLYRVEDFIRPVDNERVEIICAAKGGVDKVAFQNRVDFRA